VTVRKEQAAQSRRHLVDTALRLFVEQGYAATSISQILEEAGISRGALYHHFPDGKQELFVAVVEVVDHQLHEGFEDILDRVTSPVEQLVAGIDVLLRLSADRQFARIILIEAAAVMPGAWTDGSEFVLLRDALSRAVEAGELAPVPLDATASALYGAARRAADFVARSPDPGAAAADCRTALLLMIDGLRAT
jgi:AcrR family transcriptional regulator